MLLTIALLSLLGCIAMMVQDASGTILVIAENRGNARLAGLMDMAGDASKFLMFAYSGTLLMSNFGWLGRLFILPILATGFTTTNFVTNWAARRIPNTTDSNQDKLIKDLIARIEELERGQSSQL